MKLILVLLLSATLTGCAATGEYYDIPIPQWSLDLAEEDNPMP